MTDPRDKNNMIWIDMEMSGLDPAKERILEIATIITDGQLRIIEEGPRIVIHQPAKILKGMDAWNQKHHKKSGLIDEVTASRVTLKKAEQRTLEFIKKHCQYKKSPLCGNSVHHDRKFMSRYMPKLDDYIHYRIIDVSTLKGLIHRWYPKLKNHPKKTENHRALDDIRESIEELRFYRKYFFKSRVSLKSLA